ncbi:hypothetical protein PMZ80_004531 [Knufia obscura]|uniref:Uncharacterized protein n=2 Tax=Knufia TaxID=430999 RepID=A0AAN8I6G7_9EURO|nr:hypothetical protein PMZ80_004531 [Knufia obscura]KAK5951590.1 hypothetical protein OHC33_007268 [Knufia fluminis]
MRQSQTYTSSDYTRDTGFPLVWLVTCLFTRRAKKSAQDEVEENAERERKARAGKIVGKPAPRETSRAGVGAGGAMAEQKRCNRAGHVEVGGP